MLRKAFKQLYATEYQRRGEGEGYMVYNVWRDHVCYLGTAVAH
jgi:hypothetical protein